MKKQMFARPLALAFAVIFAISSCSGAVTAEKKIENGKFGGIVIDSSTAATVPIISTTEAEESSDSSESAPDTLSEPDEASETSDSVHETEITEQGAADTTTATAAETTTVTTTTAKTTTSATTAASTTSETTTAAATTAALTTAETTTAATTTSAAPAAAPTSYKKNSYNATNYVKVKAVWISYIEINNLLLGKNEADFRTAIGGIYDNCLSLGLNTVYVHVRAYGDAFYFSSLYPFTKYLSGTLGTRTSYDPLPIMIEEAHKRRIAFHAWINPLRLCSAADMPKVSSDYRAGAWYKGDEKGKYIVNVGDNWFLNPAYGETIKLVGDGVREIVSNYNVDGIHIDDYFYPTTDAGFDSAAFAASGKASLSEFRIGNINNLIREMCTAAHECGTGVIFGASTQGNNTNNLTQLYADTAAWCKGGYVDYFTPQIYYGFDNLTQPFKTCTDGWRKLVSGTNVKLYIGLAVYKVGNEDKWAGAAGYSEWVNTRTMLKRQIEYVNSCSDCKGIALYCYNYLFTDGYRTAAMKEEIANFKPLLTE